MDTRWFVAGGLAALLALSSQAAGAKGQLQAGPTRLEIAPQQGATRLTLRNTGDAPVAAQVRVYAWSQPAGEDRLVPTESVVASPPITELPTGVEQVVRIVRTGAAASGRDQSFRVVVDELPRPPDGDDSRVAVRMRYVVPLFLRAADAAEPDLSCTLAAAGRRLVCNNRGGRAAQLGATRLLGGEGQVVALSEGLFGYVLPASRRVWELAAETDRLDGALRLETQLNGRSKTLPVERAP